MDLRFQLHLHTTESKGTRVYVESLIEPKQAIDIAKMNNIDGIAITDHDKTTAYDKVKNYAKEKNIILINGIEFDTSDGHIIGLNVDTGIEKKIRKGMSALEVCDIIKDSSGEVYIPHPFDIRRKGLGKKIKKVDGIIEVFNSLDIFGFEDKYASYVASKLKRPIAAGADAHKPDMINLGITVVDSEPDEFSVLKSIKKGNVRFENCRHLTLKDMKELSLDRVISSYEYIKEEIKNGWEVDMKYMKIANCRFMKPIENFVLDLGVRNRHSRIWDFVTYISYVLTILYGQHNKRDFKEFISKL
jgi:hypothetical protein